MSLQYLQEPFASSSSSENARTIQTEWLDPQTVLSLTLDGRLQLHELKESSAGVQWHLLAQSRNEDRAEQEGEIWDMSCSSDMKTVLLSDFTGLEDVELWRINEDTTSVQRVGHHQRERKMYCKTCLHPDGQVYISSCTTDEGEIELSVHSADTVSFGTVLHTTTLSNEYGSPTWLTFSPDGQTLAIGTTSSNVHLYRFSPESTSPTPLAVLKWMPTPRTTTIFTTFDNDHHIYVSRSDGWILFYDIKYTDSNPQPIYKIRPFNQLPTHTCSPTRITSSDGSTQALLLVVSPQSKSAYLYAGKDKVATVDVDAEGVLDAKWRPSSSAKGGAFVLLTTNGERAYFRAAGQGAQVDEV